MKKTISIALFTAAVVLTTNPAYSAGYVKLGDIKGESVEAEPAPATPKNRKKADPSEPESAALLLPAVQHVREAGGSSKPKKKGNAETTWKVEKGEK